MITKRFNIKYYDFLNSKVSKKASILLLAFLVISLSLLLPLKNLYEQKVRVIIELYDEESLKEIEALIPLHLISKLEGIMKGAIIELPQSYLYILKELKKVKVYQDREFQVYLQKSTEWIGASTLWSKPFNLTGKGVKIAVIDTGVDYTHKDLGGKFGVKVIGGYDFVDNDKDPMDTDGHGTMVAGIIAANGSLKGIAPGASILAYRVLSSKNPLKLSNILMALEKSMEDGANIVNLSLGTFEDELLRKVINNLMEKGIIVVAAVGNSGPFSGTISDPAGDKRVLGVGSSLNFSPYSLSSSLKIDGKVIESYPLNGSAITEREVKGDIVFVNYAREKDLKGLDLRGKIALAERGGEYGEIVYFAEKELNVARKGAIALIIYNSLPGIFFGTLTDSGLPNWLRAPNYHPTLPTVSISREDGLKIRALLQEGKELNTTLLVKVYPDKVAPFSSRGPSSPFTIKPNLVAPGSFINSTFINNSYKLISGTSFASPHVAGGIALIKEKYPYLSPEEIFDLLSVTSKPLKDINGKYEPIFSQGSGRMDLLNALTTPIILSPSNLVLHLAEDQSDSRELKILPLRPYKEVKAYLYFPYKDRVDLKLDLSEQSLRLSAKALNLTRAFYEARLLLNVSSNSLTVPIAIYVNSLGLNWKIKNETLIILPRAREDYNGLFNAKLYYPDGKEEIQRSYEKVISFPLRGSGEYWVEVEALDEDGRKVGRAIILIGKEISPSIIKGSLGEDEDKALNGSYKETSAPLSIIIIRSLPFLFLVFGLIFIFAMLIRRRKKMADVIAKLPHGEEET
ncbi:MAG: S8 family serine peptidase [Nitrososphaerales archaeon]